ncbi:nitrite reductase [bacterium]|nr:nitrite reductase [bacterium]
MRKPRHLFLLALVILVCILASWRWSQMINAMLPADSRPVRVTFPSSLPHTPLALQGLAAQLAAEFPRMAADFHHLDHFLEAGIDRYEGPATCLQCHREITVPGEDGNERRVDLLQDLTDSVHYRFFSRAHPNVYGFNGKSADDFAMGKINRPCPKPGSFAMTAWAELIVTTGGDTLSEGCGQCHIGGQHQAPLGEMMPGYRTLGIETEAIDCLICHAAAYDMARRQVTVGPDQRRRWGQDRSLKAALSVTRPTTRACLRCHQHNMGGDIYVDEADSTFMPAIIQLGADRPRVQHPGSKRGTPFSPSWDVHAAAGVTCLDCHEPVGHRIPRGTHTTTIMANDLPGREVGCAGCHEPDPHDAATTGGRALNDHLRVIACQTCHIPSLQEDNVTHRDFGETGFEEEKGIHLYRDSLKEHLPGRGIAYAWWNGDATFLGNPIGDNPNGAGLYRFYTAPNRWPEYADFDYAAWYEQVMRPLAAAGRPSKLYPLKRFNGRQHIDLQNIGPFGGMFVPYNLPEYYRFGDPDNAARLEMNKSMMGRMYGWMFKFYMLDRFMSYMDIDGWNTDAYADVVAGRQVEPRWLPNDALLEISHAIRLEGALTCADCHRPDGVLDWVALGYTPEETDRLAAPQTME